MKFHKKRLKSAQRVKSLQHYKKQPGNFLSFFFFLIFIFFEKPFSKCHQRIWSVFLKPLPNLLPRCLQWGWGRRDPGEPVERGRGIHLFPAPQTLHPRGTRGQCEQNPWPPQSQACGGGSIYLFHAHFVTPKQPAGPGPPPDVPAAPGSLPSPDKGSAAPGQARAGAEVVRCPPPAPQGGRSRWAAPARTGERRRAKRPPRAPSVPRRGTRTSRPRAGTSGSCSPRAGKGLSGSRGRRAGSARTKFAAGPSTGSPSPAGTRAPPRARPAAAAPLPPAPANFAEGTIAPSPSRPAPSPASAGTSAPRSPGGAARLGSAGLLFDYF